MSNSYSEWKDVPGYDGKYQASYFGKVRRIYKNASPKLLTAYLKKSRKGSDSYVVKLTLNGVSKEVKQAKIIYETFAGNIPKGYSVFHKDGDLRENRFTNLELLTKSEVAKKTAYRSKHKPVTKYEVLLNPVDMEYQKGICPIRIEASGILISTDTYRSAREAAKQNNMSYQTVIDRCNHRVTKSLRAPDGYVYYWDNEHEYAA